MVEYLILCLLLVCAGVVVLSPALLGKDIVELLSLFVDWLLTSRVSGAAELPYITCPGCGEDLVDVACRCMDKDITLFLSQLSDTPRSVSLCSSHLDDEQTMGEDSILIRAAHPEDADRVVESAFADDERGRAVQKWLLKNTCIDIDWCGNPYRVMDIERDHPLFADALLDVYHVVMSDYSLPAEIHAAIGDAAIYQLNRLQHMRSW